MARRIDYAKQSRLRGASADLAFAHNLLLSMRDKSAELQSLSSRAVGGHPVGDEMVANAAKSVDSLSQALLHLMNASESARGVDVTVEVPDETADGRY